MESSDQEHQQLAWSKEIPDYGNKLLKRLDEFRKTALYDVCVHTRNGDFNAHKVILAACGGIFRTCFVDDERKIIGDTREITLECPAQGLKTIIRFAYSGSLVVTKRNAVATMIAAEVTKMKEVQEICASIAVQEYGWIVRFTDEKSPGIIEKLKKVLQIHTTCFSSTTSENEVLESVDSDDFPFVAEVESEIPEHMMTYHQLAVKLRQAEMLGNAAPSSKVKKESDSYETKLSCDKANYTTTPTPVARKTVDAVAEKSNSTVTVNSPRESILPKVEIDDQHIVEKGDADNADSKIAHHSENEKLKEVSSRSTKPKIPPLPEVANNKDSDSNHEDNQTKETSNAPAGPVAKNTKAEYVLSEVESAKTATTGGVSAERIIENSSESNAEDINASPRISTVDVAKTPTDDTPRIPLPDLSTSVSPEAKSVADGGGRYSQNNGNSNHHLLQHARRDNIPKPSPKVKPRASMKVKRAPPPPSAVSADKPTTEKLPAPRRPGKLPPKVPPPRPKPPIKKKAMSEADAEQKNPTNEDYDDTLNPFA